MVGDGDVLSPFGTTGEVSATLTVTFGVRLPSVTLYCGGLGHWCLRHHSVWSLLYSSAWMWPYQDKPPLPGGTVETNSRSPSQLKVTSKDECVKAWRQCRGSDSRLATALAAQASPKSQNGAPPTTISLSLVAPQGLLRTWLDAVKARSQTPPFPRHQIIWPAWMPLTGTDLQYFQPCWCLTAPYKCCSVGTGTRERKDGEEETDTDTYTCSQG